MNSRERAVLVAVSLFVIATIFSYFVWEGKHSIEQTDNMILMDVALDKARRVREAEKPSGVTETLRYSQYEISEYVPSEIDPELTIGKTIGFRCPRCKTKLAPLEHGESTTCTCGLVMELWGNGLECTLRVSVPVR